MNERGDAFTAAWNAAGYRPMKTRLEAEAAIEWARRGPDVAAPVRRAAKELAQAIAAYLRAGRKVGAL